MLRKGFTLIELLIVIAVLGILAVAVLSAINPLEQLKKARDTRRKSDSAELLNAYERYFATFGCYQWENGDGACGGTATNQTTAAANTASFAVAGFNYDLMQKEELKTQFSSRATVSKGEMFVTEAANGQVSICFSPESKSARGGGLGPVMNQTNGAAGSCGAAYTVNDLTCNVCIPQ